ncbi:MAG: choice-of-anchor B family protein, partial [Calditrichaeota bacterium]
MGNRSFQNSGSKFYWFAIAIFLAVLPRMARSGGIQRLGQLQLAGTFITDVWGYFDPQTQKEYALVGDNNAGVFIVDVTDPTNPVQVAQVSTVPGFDVKSWSHYAYSVTGNGFGSGKIVDLTDPTNPVVAGSFPSSHNIFISDDGYLFAEFPGLKVYDLNPDPTTPTLVWTASTSDGHDAAVVGTTLYDFHGYSGTNIYSLNLGDPFTATLLGSINDPAIQYHHSGWPTPDGQYLLICDELANHPTPDITVWDISDPGNPVKVGEFADPDATVHNLFVIGTRAFASYYSAGFRVLDVSDPTAPALIDEYDTSPTTGEGFTGAFGVFPFTHSGNIYISDEDSGLFVFAFQDSAVTGIDLPGGEPGDFQLAQNFPNPFNPSTTIAYCMPEAGLVTLTVYNALGQPIRTLVNAVQTAGRHQVVWDGRDARGREVAAGIYLYRLQAGRFQ